MTMSGLNKLQYYLQDAFSHAGKLSAAAFVAGSLAVAPAAAEEDEGVDLREEIPKDVPLTANTTKKVMDWHNLEPVYFANTFRRDNGEPDTVGLRETVFAVNPETDQVYVWKGFGSIQDDSPEIGEFSPLYELVTVGEKFQMNNFSQYNWFQNQHPFVERYDILEAEFSDTNPICHEMGFDPKQKLCAPYDPVMGTRINEDGRNAAFRFVLDDEDVDVDGIDDKALRTYLIGQVQNDGEKHYVLPYYTTSREGATIFNKSARDIHVTDTGVRMMRGQQLAAAEP